MVDCTRQSNQILVARLAKNRHRPSCDWSFLSFRLRSSQIGNSEWCENSLIYQTNCILLKWPSVSRLLPLPNRRFLAASLCTLWYRVGAARRSLNGANGSNGILITQRPMKDARGVWQWAYQNNQSIPVHLCFKASKYMVNHSLEKSGLYTRLSSIAIGALSWQTKAAPFVQNL